MRLFAEYQSSTTSESAKRFGSAADHRPFRLIDLVAEDNALEDTIYHLTRALDTERIDLDRFLKVCHQCACYVHTALTD